ncbi:hypothetical protein NCTGTJJY_CDS0064 [Serratia phage 92A1]|nr:hypothetical protein NCTGTJJY_CDS0064 [Serratia phage 92A1]
MNLKHIGNSRIRFMVLKSVKLDYWRSKVEVEHSYVGLIELEKILNDNDLENRRVLPIPVLGGLPLPLEQGKNLVDLWTESLNKCELLEYLD